ncbi:MAG TPA: hypothetical protein VIM73_09935 [Polyangiaceae bacterium]
MPFSPVTLTLKQSGATWIADPAPVRHPTRADFRMSANAPASGDGNPLPGGNPFTFSDPLRAGGIRDIIFNVAGDAAVVGNWHPAFNECRPVILGVEVGPMRTLESLTVNLKCSVHKPSVPAAFRKVARMAKAKVLTVAQAMMALLTRQQRT